GEGIAIGIAGGGAVEGDSGRVGDRVAIVGNSDGLIWAGIGDGRTVLKLVSPHIVGGSGGTHRSALVGRDRVAEPVGSVGRGVNGDAAGQKRHRLGRAAVIGQGVEVYLIGSDLGEAGTGVVGGVVDPARIKRAGVGVVEAIIGDDRVLAVECGLVPKPI